MEICSRSKLGRQCGQHSRSMGCLQHPTGAPEISELTRWSRAHVAAAQGALPAALIELTCALITPRLSPTSSSLESCLLHPCLRRSNPTHRRLSPGSICSLGTFFFPLGRLHQGEAELNPTVDSTEDQQGKVMQPASSLLCLQCSCTSSTHS